MVRDPTDELFKQVITSTKAREIAKEIVKIDETKIVDRVSAMAGLCDSIDMKAEYKQLMKILRGSETKGIPLRACWRFSLKYSSNFGKKFKWGSQEITTGEIDTAFSEIGVVIWKIYSRVTAGLDVGDTGVK